MYNELNKINKKKTVVSLKQHHRYKMLIVEVNPIGTIIQTSTNDKIRSNSARF